ncbi:hypothetical protein OBBRIDRAFT_260021 [Obba rivulosa]|uniref:Uncharacterized protein n=1 Tax=Obba rivulosa TaxID=1052685 RepID=A0A8E2DGM2_9APHY|nr:hypothetical protein OBBRIDRAFT_260021 [Obba rivulosa]
MGMIPPTLPKVVPSAMSRGENATFSDVIVLSDSEGEVDNDESGTFKLKKPCCRCSVGGPRVSARQRNIPAPYIRTSVSPEARARAARRSALKRARASQSGASSLGSSGRSETVESPDPDEAQSISSKRPRLSTRPQVISLPAKRTNAVLQKMFANQAIRVHHRGLVSANEDEQGYEESIAAPPAEVQSEQGEHRGSGIGMQIDTEAQNRHGAGGPSCDTSGGRHMTQAQPHPGQASKKKGFGSDFFDARPVSASRGRGRDIVSRLRSISLEYVDPPTSFAAVDVSAVDPSRRNVRPATATHEYKLGHADDDLRAESVELEDITVNPVTAAAVSQLSTQLDGANFPGGVEDHRSPPLGTSDRCKPVRETTIADSPYQDAEHAGNNLRSGSLPAAAHDRARHRSARGLLFLAPPSPSTNNRAPTAHAPPAVPMQQSKDAADTSSPQAVPASTREAVGGSPQQLRTPARPGRSSPLLGDLRARPQSLVGAAPITWARPSGLPPSRERSTSLQRGSQGAATPLPDRSSRADEASGSARSGRDCHAAEMAPQSAGSASDCLRARELVQGVSSRSHENATKLSEARPAVEGGSSPVAKTAATGAAPMIAGPIVASSDEPDHLARFVDGLRVRMSPSQVATLREIGLEDDGRIRAVGFWSDIALAGLAARLEAEGFSFVDAVTIVEGLKAAAGRLD